MKLSQVINQTNQIERLKFVNCIDKLCSKHLKEDDALCGELSKIGGQLRSASGAEITQLFKLALPHYLLFLREQLAIGGPQVSLLVNILSRDGNGLARISWLEQLYKSEFNSITALSREIKTEMEQVNSEQDQRIRNLIIYNRCVDVAFNNDVKINRQAKITEDERSILNCLADSFGMSKDEKYAIEHLVTPIPPNEVEKAVEYLREIGVVLINKRRQEIMVPDEVVEALHLVLGIELPNKFVLRILRALTDAELSNVLRNHGYKYRGVSRQNKISIIIHAGMPIRKILSCDIFWGSVTLTQRKDRLKSLISELDINVTKLGTRLDERIDLLFSTLRSSTNSEFNTLSVGSYKELLSVLNDNGLSADFRIRQDFELEECEEIEPERLKALNITPLDVLYLYSNDEVKTLRNALGLPKRGNPRTEIIKCFISASDKLIENFHLLAKRDLKSLSDIGVNVCESELGVKFEETTRSIFEQLGMNVDEDLRKEINTTKDKADIIISLDNDDVIVGEVKSHKNGDYTKYSSTVRQVKSYVNRCESSGRRVAQVLIVAPSFSSDFVNAASLDADINISLLEAKGLQDILQTFKSTRKPKFSPKLLTKGGLLKSDLICKAI